MKKKFWEYILENFTIDNNGRKIIYNIIDWVWMQSMDKEDSVNTLDFLLDGIGIKKKRSNSSLTGIKTTEGWRKNNMFTKKKVFA